MKKRIILMSACFALAAGAAFAGNTKVGASPVFDNTPGLGCPQISGCTTDVGGPVCTEKSTGSTTDACANDVPAFQITP